MAFRHLLPRPLLVTLTLAALAAAGLGYPARADGFDARPVLIETRNGLASVVITNPGERRIYLETVIYDWSQNASGAESLTESDLAMASPPAMWVNARSTYNLRVKLPADAAGHERAYRVVVRQLPDRSDISTGHIVFALSQSFPAFVEPASVPAARLHGRLVDAHHILIVNDGGRRARLADLKQDGQVLVAGLAGYALARAARLVELPAPVHAGAIEFETENGHQTIDFR